MKILNKIVGFLAVCSVVPAAYALTARPGVVNPATTASRRLPTMTSYLTGTTSVIGATTTSSSLLDNAECIDAYTDCISASDACGPNFEECTTNVLFHAQMPKCLSVLAQCTASGINDLFGTSSTTALSNIKTQNEHGEVTEYTYPTAGSVMGQMITGAAIANMYSTGDCVRRYTTCLQRDNVCGAEFELCTTTNEFRKQRVYCDSTLARCAAEGKIELFGSAMNANNPTSDSRVGVMIDEGAALAAVNAVSTCYKVADQCILNACAANPYKCISGSSRYVAYLADAINSGELNLSANDLLELSDTFSNSEIQGYIRNACLDTIGANKYCYATFLGNGAMPSSSQLADPDNQEMIFDDAYAARMNSSMRAKISDAMQQFDSAAKSSCSDTISSCVMRVCGGGSGASCYALVFSQNGNNSINGGATYDQIKTGCEAIVNTDPNCQYAAANPDDVGGYVYTYNQTGAFDVLFPPLTTGGFSSTGTVYGANSDDPIGVVASLNASLSTSYSDAAIAQLRTRCENVAKSCVKSMCGDEYTNCYRNRTDIYSSLTQTDTASFDNSMNKVGGVLDYTIVLGLCLDTVKNADACQEHLDIEIAKLNSTQPGNLTSSWGEGTSNVRQGWLDAGSSVKLGTVEDGTQVRATDANGNALCRADNGAQGVCDTVAADGTIYDEPIYISTTAYRQNLAAENLFSELVYDLEKEAQAIYNSKLTQEQNMCLAQNNGGIMSGHDTGSTFMWAKLRNNRVPNDYNVNGLSRNNFDPSNELYGSFCAMRVTVQSDDADIQEAMRDASWTNAYFAVGDSFTCGSWIPSSALEEMANAAAKDATSDMVARQGRTEFWTTLLGAVGGGLGGAYLGAGIADGSVFGKLTGLNNKKDDVAFTADNAKILIEQIREVLNKTTEKIDVNDTDLVETMIKRVHQFAKDSNADNQTIKTQVQVVNNWVSAQDAYLGFDEEFKRYECNCSLNSRTSNTTNAANATTCQSLCNADTKATRKITADDKKASALSAMGHIEALLTGVDGQVKEKKDLTPVWSALGTVVLGTAGGLLVNKATRDIQQSNLDAAEKAAYEEFMNKVGSHIKCYIGAEEAGQYGDILSITLQ